MAIYRLVRDDGETECEVDARNDDHALAVLSGKLKKALTFDGTAGPQFILQRIDEKEATFRRLESRAVYEVVTALN
jgi:hypothetical protein